ncbi:hypothetical protein R6Q59_023783 [Mikania micrantha]
MHLESFADFIRTVRKPLECITIHRRRKPPTGELRVVAVVPTVVRNYSVPSILFLLSDENLNEIGLTGRTG